MMNSFDLVPRIEAELRSAGLVVEDVDLSGELVRCGTTKKPHGTDGSYVVHLDFPPSLWLLNRHEMEEGRTVPFWTQAEVEAMTPEERKAQAERIRKQREDHARQQEERHRAAAERAGNIFRSLAHADVKTPYLSHKGVDPLGDMRKADAAEIPVQGLSGEVLVLPVRKADKSIASLQFIDGAGNKRFLSGGEKKGCFFPIPAKNGSEDGVLLIGEGVATVLSACMATGYAGLVPFDAGNLLPVGETARAKSPDRKLVFLMDDDCTDHEGNTRPDNENTGYVASRKAAASCGGVVAVPQRLKDSSGRDRSTDFNDLHLARGLDAVRECILKALEYSPKKTRYHCLNIKELIERDYPPREPLLAPILALQSLSMVFAMRGVGKTFFALSCAYAVASGGTVFGRWFAPHPARVLYIDGEMPAVTLQERLRNIAISSESDITDPDMLRILTPDEQYAAMPNLATLEGQQAVEPFLDGVALVVVDNIATLARTGKSNDEDSWMPIQTWLLSLRRRGISVLLVHHAGKNGSQRGTGAKEDILDTVLELKRPSDYSPKQGARFEVHFTKARGLYGEDTEPFEAMLSVDALGQCTWQTRRVADLREERIVELLEAGLSERDIVEELKDSGVTRYQVKSVRRQQEGKGKRYAKSGGGAGTHKDRF